jgi:hypothetical protein
MMSKECACGQLRCEHHEGEGFLVLRVHFVENYRAVTPAQHELNAATDTFFKIVGGSYRFTISLFSTNLTTSQFNALLVVDL